ncbi:MAG: hypothetical protein KAX33_10275 [Candidatus Lokiarchaeota archaeon]|nr:hypothetical protein [Candidatus Lokiarchaeota archaeon]
MIGIQNDIIAETIAEVGTSAMDFFTWGHIAMGFGFFALLSFLHIYFKYIKQSDKFPIWLAFLITVIIGIFWEFFENFVLWSWGLKFEGRQDSLLNASMDIIFVTLAAAFYLLLWKLLIKPGEMKSAYITYTVYLIGFILMLIFYFVGRMMTL